MPGINTMLVSPRHPQPPIPGDMSYFNTPFKLAPGHENNFEKTYLIMQESSAEKFRMKLF